MIGVVAATDTATTRPTSGATEGHARLERIFAELDAPFALVDLDAMWCERARDAHARGGQADPGGQQVGALPAAAGAHPATTTSASAGS